MTLPTTPGLSPTTPQIRPHHLAELIKLPYHILRDHQAVRLWSMSETPPLVRALAWEDPTCRGADGPVSHNC